MSMKKHYLGKALASKQNYTEVDAYVRSVENIIDLG